MAEKKKMKSFWQRPEGITGALILGVLLIGSVWAVTSFIGGLTSFFLGSTLGMVVGILALGVVIFTALDSKARALVSYMYKSAMRGLTGIFIEMNPIAILKSYIDDLRGNLKKMRKQITQLRGQMHKLKELIFNNKREIQSNLTLASEARDKDQRNVMILKSRKAGRLKESNVKLEDLYTKMEVLYRVLSKMYDNSAILVEDVEDQVKVKEQEYEAMKTSHSAMRSAMNIIKGNADKRAMFDQAMDAIADDVSQKVGEMERFMDLSENFMASIDLQNGVFEEEGMKMLEEWEAKGTALLLGGEEEKEHLILEAESDTDILDISEPIKKPEKIAHKNQYDSFFD